MEGRVEDVLKNYSGKITPEVVNQFADAQKNIDPSINNKYLEWMVKQYIEGKPENGIINVITKWHKNLSKMGPDIIANALINFGSENSDISKIEKNPKDINAYSFKELELVTKELENKLSGAELDAKLKGSTRIIYDDPQYRIVVPLSYKSSCKYGAGTKWCIASNKTSEHFDRYSLEGILFFIIDKTMPHRIGHPLYKVAVHMNRKNGSVTIWNAPDTNIGTDLNVFFPKEMITAMNNYRQKYVVDMEKLSRTINSKLGSYKSNINGWELGTHKSLPALSDGEFIAKLDVQLKHKNLDITLYANENSISSFDLLIPGEQIKEIEDIMIEYDGDDVMLQTWIKDLISYISYNWKKIISKFEPVMMIYKISEIINKKINNFTGNWKFEQDTIPSETNLKCSYKSVRTIPVEGNDYTYTLVLILDLLKYQYIFKAEEERSRNQKEHYEDQITPFDKSLIKDKSKLISSFLDWAKEIVDAVYDESWVEGGNTEEDILALRNLAGKYSSKQYGGFNVEIDSDNKIHVYSEKLGTHYLINNITEFNERIIKKYDLKKIK
jgi:hypothetical protein